MNVVKDLLKSGKTVIGTTGSAFGDMAMLADSGFDFLLFDTQHSPVESKQLIPALQAMRGKKAAPIIRVSANRAELICFALDAGARGIVVPMVNTKEEAIDIVTACRYSPLGNRSHAGVFGEWGESKDYRSYLDMVNEGLLIIPMIETQQAIDNIDEILNVPGWIKLLLPAKTTEWFQVCTSSRLTWTLISSWIRDSSSSPCAGLNGRQKASRMVWLA